MPRTAKLTDNLSDKIAATITCPAGRAEVIHWDNNLPGFGLRVRATGTHSWLAQYGLAGKTKRLTLGNPPTVTYRTAREAARTAMAAVRIGGDPAGAKVAARADAKVAASAAITVGSLVPKFLERQVKTLRPRSLVEVQRYLLRYAAPLHDEPVATIKRLTISELLDAVATAHGDPSSNKMRSALSSFFLWVAGKGHRDDNPVSLIPKAPENGKRERALSDTELAAVYRALAAVDGDFADIVRLLALLGLRRSEVADLVWSEIDLDAALISIPKERMKAGVAFTVPLAGPALTILKARFAAREIGSDRVFVSVNFGVGKRLLDAAVGRAVAHWRLHDLRRTMSTRLHGKPFSYPPHICESLLAHANGGKIAATYNVQRYEPERREALAVWGKHIERISGGNVIRLDPARAA